MIGPTRRGVSIDVLAREALGCALDYDGWFIREVEGLATSIPDRS